jgi:hypothetical protein
MGSAYRSAHEFVQDRQTSQTIHRGIGPPQTVEGNPTTGYISQCYPRHKKVKWRVGPLDKDEADRSLSCN